VLAGLNARSLEMVDFTDAIDRVLHVGIPEWAAAIDQSVSPGFTVTTSYRCAVAA